MPVDFEQLVGSRLVIGIPGTKATPEIVKHLRALHVGGVIFYRINFASPDQLRQLITDLESALGRRLLVCLDHEGGRVVMYGDGVTVFPDNLAVGHTGDPALAEAMGRVAAKELRALGADVNFAPVVDVITDAYSPNIGIRSFGMDPASVAEMGARYITALQAGGVSATAKHFPGKGHSPLDAHLKLPTIPSTWEEMQAVHVQPFVAAIRAGVDVIMSSHPRYPRLDPDPQTIATFSRRIITDFLRDELGFRGAIASDDLEMGAVREICPPDVAAVKAAAAGHDLILSCHDAAYQRKVFQGLVDAYRGRLLPVDEMEASVERVEALRRKRPARFSGAPGPAPEGAALADTIAERAVTILQDPGNIIPFPDALAKDVGIIFPRLSALASRIMIEPDFLDEEGFFERELAPYPGGHVTEVYAIDPEEEDITDAANLARRSSATIFFCFDAHLHPEERKLLTAVEGATKKLVVVLLRDPYDKTFLKPQDAAITAFGFRRTQIRAVLRRIYGL